MLLLAARAVARPWGGSFTSILSLPAECVDPSMPGSGGIGDTRAFIAAGLVEGANRSITLPSRPMRNLVKFHLYRADATSPGRSRVQTALERAAAAMVHRDFRHHGGLVVGCRTVRSAPGRPGSDQELGEVPLLIGPDTAAQRLQPGIVSCFNPIGTAAFTAPLPFDLVMPFAARERSRSWRPLVLQKRFAIWPSAPSPSTPSCPAELALQGKPEAL